MNSLEAEYSFLAPTWKLPSVATPSMYSRTYGTPFSSNAADSGPDLTLWNNTMYNSRYIPSYVPSTTFRRNYQQPNNQYGSNLNLDDGLNLTVSLHANNEYDSYKNMPNYAQPQQPITNRGLTYSIHGQNNYPPPPPAQKRRVQIIDHNRHTPSTVNNDPISGRQSHNHTPDSIKSQPKSKPSVSNQHRDHVEENRFGYTGNTFNIHEYLYGLAEPDPGSYTDAFKHQQRRLQEEKISRKSVMSEYKTFVQNGGFGPSFGNTEYQRYGEKIDSDKKKRIYSKTVREINQTKIDEQKRIQNNNGHPKTRPAPVPKYQRAREYANTIERPHHLKPVFQTEFSSQNPLISPLLITSLSNNQRRSSLDDVQSSNLSDVGSGEFNINRSRRSSSIRTQRRVRFHSRDFIRRRSSTLIDLPSHIIGKSIPCRTDSLLARSRTEKSASKILDEKDERQKPNSSNFLFQSVANKNEKKFITSHSMIMAKNMRLPPTVTVVINQTYKPSLTATPSTNNYLKKSIFNKDILPSQCSIPSPVRRSTIILKADFDLSIKSFHHTDGNKNSSNE